MQININNMDMDKICMTIEEKANIKQIIKIIHLRKFNHRIKLFTRSNNNNNYMYKPIIHNKKKIKILIKVDKMIEIHSKI